MKTFSLFDDTRHFVLDNILSWIPQQVSRIFIHALLTVGIIGGWKLFKKHAKRFR